MAKTEQKPKKAWWIDQSSCFSGGISFGEEMPSKVPQSRLDQLEKLEKISYEEPEEKEEVTASQVDKLRIALSKALEENKGLKETIEKAPKGVKEAQKEVTRLTLELTALKESDLKSDPAKAQELATAKTRVTELEGEVVKLKEDLNTATAPGAK